MEKERWQSRSSKLLFTVLILFIIYVVLKYAFGIIFPFLAGFIIAVPLASLSNISSRKLGGGRKAWGVFYTCVFWLFLFAVILLGIRKLLLEADEMLAFFGEHISAISEKLSSFVEMLASIPSKIPILNFGGADVGNIGDEASGFLSTVLDSAKQKGSELIGLVAGKIAIGTPRAIAGFAVCVVSSFYFCKDYEEIKKYVVGYLSKKSRKNTKKAVLRALEGIRSYGKAYLWLFLITFLELLVGLIVLRRKYALVLALMIALLDILPALGTGIVRVPWAVILISDGAVGIGVGMLVLFAVIVVVRQIVEPRLVGRELGIHPLASLAAMYIGFGVFGFVGMLSAPISVVVIREIIKNDEPQKE